MQREQGSTDFVGFLLQIRSLNRIIRNYCISSDRGTLSNVADLESSKAVRRSKGKGRYKNAFRFKENRETQELNSRLLPFVIIGYL